MKDQVKHTLESGLRYWICIMSILLAAAGTMVQAADPVLVWSDEFDADGLPDESKWMYDVGGDGWGNNEQQFYTEGRLENARVEGGVLIIEAHKEQWLANPVFKSYNDYTSARLVSKGNGDWLYGRIEVRAKLPAGRGTWPAIWMLPTGNAYGGWPRSGEIDIMEHLGFDMGRIHGSLHSLAHNWVTETQPTCSVVIADVNTAFHDYAIDWSPTGISFLVDDSQYFSATNPGTGWEQWPYDQPFHLIMNLAVGGFLGGQEGIDPNIWPQRMEVDYVRVYDLGDSITVNTDGDEFPNATDPDDDNDGLTDAEEHRLGTNLLVTDTDEDGYSDFEEVEADSNPLSSGSIPGSGKSLLTNADFHLGEDPWIVHTNKFDAEGKWKGMAGSWGGAYAVSDYISSPGGGDIVFSNYTGSEVPNAEHLLYQEWGAATLGLVPGDVIRFRGVASSDASTEGFVTEAFIRVLNRSFQMLDASVSVAVGPETDAFEVETILEEGNINVIQVGVLIEGSTSETATVNFTDIEATVNEKTTLYVDDNGLNDPGPYDPLTSDPLEDGSSDHPFDSIQEAIDTAIDGMIICVYDGIYSENLRITGKSLSFQRAQADPNLAPLSVIVDGSAQNAVVSWFGSKESNSVIDGFILTGGYGLKGGGLYCEEINDLILTNCVLVNNTADSGCGLYALNSTLQLSNCTLLNNSDLSMGAIVSEGSIITVTNSILWGNFPREIYVVSGGDPNITSSCIENGYPGDDNIDVDPMFLTRPEDGPVFDNYHLDVYSPCIDLGDSAGVVGLFDIDLDQRITGQGVDIGADEVQPPEEEDSTEPD